MEKEKPFEIKLDEATNKLISVINEIYASGVPYYYISLIYRNIGALISDRVKADMETIRNSYEKEMKKDGEKDE